MVAFCFGRFGLRRDHGAKMACRVSVHVGEDQVRVTYLL